MHCTTFKDYRIRWEYTYYLLSLLSIVYQQIEKKFFLLPFMILFSIFIWHLRKRKPITQIFFFPFQIQIPQIFLFPREWVLYGIVHIRGIFSKHLAAKELLESRKSRKHFKLSKEQQVKPIYLEKMRTLSLLCWNNFYNS